MDNNINGNYVNLRIQQSQTEKPQESSQSDVQPREYSTQMHNDAAAEMLGRSQLLHVNIPSAPEPVKLMGLKDILSDEHINDEAADKILMQFGFSTEECAALRKKYPAINNIAEVMNMAILNFGKLEDSSKEHILEMIEYVNKTPEELEQCFAISQKNMEILSEKYGLSGKEAFEFLEDFAENFDKCNAAFKISQLTGDPLAKTIHDVYYYGRNFVCPNDKQLFAMKKIEDSVGLPFSIYKAGLIEKPEQITPQFIENLNNELESFKNQKINIVEIEKDPVLLLEDIKKINAAIKKYGLDFSKIDAREKFKEIRELVNTDYLEKSADFLSQCSDKVKEQNPNQLIRFAKDKNFMENAKGMANLLSTVAEIPKNHMIHGDLFEKLKARESVDIEGLTKVAQAFADVGDYTTDSRSSWPLFADDFKTNKPNYDECAKFIHKIQEFYGGEDSEYSLRQFMSQVWRGIDYENYESCFAKLKEMGLYGKIAPWDMKYILENAGDPNAFMTAVKYKNNPIVSSSAYLFGKFDNEKIDEEYNKICESIKNLNPNYKDMDVNDCGLILRSYSSLKHDFYNKLQFGFDINDETLDIDKVLTKNKKFDCAEYAHKFFATDFPNINIKDKIQIFNDITETNKDLIFEILSNGKVPKERLLDHIKYESLLWYSLRDTAQAENIFENQKNIVLENPDRYVNGEYETKEDMQAEVDRFFDNYQSRLRLLSSATDKEAVNYLLRMRFEDAKEYLMTIAGLGCSDLDLLARFNNAVNVDGKPFLPAQKIGFIDLLKAYKDNNLSRDKIQTMLDSGKVDFAELNMDLFYRIMENAGITKEEIASIPKEKLIGWDTKYIHLLAKDIQEEQDQAYSDILRAGNLADFREYIHDTSNNYGKTNAVTRQKYTDAGMDYEKWINPSKENEVDFVATDDNHEKLLQIQRQFLEDIETLRQGPVKGFIDKQYPKCIKNNEFIIPQEYTTSKAKLNDFITGVIKALDPVWKRAQGNAQHSDPKRVATARNTLTILDHFNQRIKDIESITETKAMKNINVKIKMWDRVPQKDIFQGDYSTCCIGMGETNSSAMPYYLMNTAFNMIEFVDNVSGKTMGNALCYFVKDNNEKPVFVIDNIEINNAQKPSDYIGLKLRNAIIQYAANVAKDVTGNDDIQIVMSENYNDVPYEDLPVRSQTINFVGDITKDDIYVDLYDGWVDKKDLIKPTRCITRVLK